MIKKFLLTAGILTFSCSTLVFATEKAPTGLKGLRLGRTQAFHDATAHAMNPEKTGENVGQEIRGAETL